MQVFGEDVELWEPTHSASGGVNWQNHLEAIWENLKKFKKWEGICVYRQLIHFAVQ